MELVQLDIPGVIDTLRTMPMPDGLTACGLIVDYDDTTDQYIAHVAVIVKYTQWNDEAIKACQNARSLAWDALRPFGIIPHLLCRTEAEHAELIHTEPAWTPIADDDC